MNASKVLAIVFVALLASGFLVYFFTPISSAATNIWCFPQNPLASCTTGSSSGTTTISTNTQITQTATTTVSSSNNAISLSVANRNPQISVGGSGNDPFTITTTIPLNMTAIAPSGFVVTTSPKAISTSSSTTSGTVTISVPNSIRNGNYVVTLEAISGPDHNRYSNDYGYSYNADSHRDAVLLRGRFSVQLEHHQGFRRRRWKD